MPDPPAAMSAAEQWINDRRRGWESRLDRLGDVLSDEAPKDGRIHDPAQRNT